MWLFYNNIPIKGTSSQSWASWWTTHPVQCNLAIEGHSFVAPINVDPPAALSTLLPLSVNVSGSAYNGAIGGTNLQHLLDNAATLDGKLVTETGTLKNILVVWSLNVSDIEGSGLTNYTNYKAYLVARASAGWKVFVYTLTPSLRSTMGDQWEIEKEVFNGLMRSDLALVRNIHVLDTDTVPELLLKSDTDFFW